eukprot:XP_019075744.1 PREDICTED: subtilisin-like protease SBT1.6 [Vitis vinifera]
MNTVAASSTDRDFISDIVLGDGANFNGESLSLFEMNASTSIISASEAYAGYFTPYQSSYCLETSLNNTKARRKILVCQHAESSTDSKLAKSAVVREAGGVGRSMGTGFYPILIIQANRFLEFSLQKLYWDLILLPLELQHFLQKVPMP